ncbi:Aminotransferase, class IV [Pseudocohnilembus persalinus]|uniref:Aminotransferase, class IV n=1 Tax=Pseudocohnilembus persalinus TaxID=266149 RepID=A0A0V0QA65_PSEPJ|nr:Aminotransferase, class IV [Pseudocohnilembus persalinus]|eukprot:KRW99050.1 Aminotransferase, class IV [Pseudocohnilembus persalinus]
MKHLVKSLNKAVQLGYNKNINLSNIPAECLEKANTHDNKCDQQIIDSLNLKDKKVSYQGRTKIASREEVLQKFKEKFSEKKIELVSYYNSELDCLIDDPSLMVVPIDDRIFNRAHGVFESITFSNFQFNTFQAHLERLQRSCEKVGIHLDMSIQQMQSIMIDVAQHTYQQLSQQGRSLEELLHLVVHLRIWVSSGRKDFGIYSVGKEPIFYCASFVNHELASNLHKISQGIKEFTVSHEYLQELETVKSTAYLQNCVTADFAKQRGGYQGIRLDEEGHILEQAMANVAYIDKNTKEFVTSLPDRIVAGTTMKKVINNYVEPVLIKNKVIKGVVRKNYTLQDILENGSEFMCFGGDKVIPILSVNDEQIADGQMGPICKNIQQWYKEQMKEGDLTEKPHDNIYVIPITLEDK